MDSTTAKKEINKSIKGIKAERSTEIFNSLGLNYLNEIYYTHSPQLATIANHDLNVTTVVGTMGIAIGVIYTALLTKHFLSKDIESLKLLKEKLIKYNILENTSIEQFRSDVASRKYVKEQKQK